VAADIPTRNMCGRPQVRLRIRFGLHQPFHPDAGGWWVRPSNWASNTVIAVGGMAAVLYAVWHVSANNEVRVSSFLPLDNF
jgi:hypothetical protein